VSSLNDRFAAAWAEVLQTVDVDLLPSALTAVCVEVLPFDAAGISLHGGPAARVPLGSSDVDAATAERLQFTHGDGPCFLAMREGRPVVATQQRWQEQWPVLAEEHFARTAFHGGLAVPLRVGATRFGVLDLYSRMSRTLDGSVVIDGQVVAALVTSVLLQHLHGDDLDRAAVVSPIADLDATWLNGRAAVERRQVWVATGMVGLSLGIASDEALSILRAHSFATSRTVDELAGDIVQGRLDVGELELGTSP
jgi:hypothetical protein